jgi:hypothetical protein
VFPPKLIHVKAQLHVHKAKLNVHKAQLDIHNLQPKSTASPYHRIIMNGKPEKRPYVSIHHNNTLQLSRRTNKMIALDRGAFCR